MGVRRMRSQLPIASSKKVRFSSMRMRHSSGGLAVRTVSAITCAPRWKGVWCWPLGRGRTTRHDWEH
jgi:hypothetical protein